MWRSRAVTLVHLLVVGGVALIALAPRDPAWVERRYGATLYPPLQAWLTSRANAVPFALFDLLTIGVPVVWVLALAVATRRAWRGRTPSPAVRLVTATLSGLAVVYLWFLIAWGFNYERPGIGVRLGSDPRRISGQAVLALGRRAVDGANRLADTAHRAGFPPAFDEQPTLRRALGEVEGALGRPRASVPGRPKWSVWSVLFRASGTDGMTAPFFLETLLNPDLTPPERPMVLAHEWAHLSGLAPEADASVVAVLACLRAGVAEQYSAWLMLVIDVAGRLPADQRAALTATLAATPRRDWQAIVDRLRSRVEVVETVSWQAYDRYLRSQGVDEGLVNYSRVIELLLSTDAIDRFGS